MNPDAVKLNYVLNDLDISSNPDGSQRSFSIRFIKSNGESVYLNRAVKTGLNFNLKENAMRGVRPVDSELKPIGHIYAVKIWHIVEYNNLTVVL